MSQINLQNDNNTDNKKNKKKSGSFFDSDENTEEYVERSENVNAQEPEKKEPLTREQIQRNNRARLKKIVAVVAAALCVMLIVNFVADLDIVKNAGYGDKEDKGNKTKLYIYPADWETDIFTNESYLALKRDVVYSPNGVEFITLDPSSYYRYGGSGLVFMMDYINTVIAGDHEKLNGMFSEEYWKTRDEDGKKREKYSDFPQQKLFNVKIVKYQYNDPMYNSAAYDDHYYIVSYNIYRNDGMFRDDIDEYSELAQMVTVLLDPDGNGQIINVIDLPGYIAGHMG
ncbi:MAG: hypothetical protein IJV70_05325 [Clostridia bacterium]|nr:hypothetical protein [Clostridia bacterium]